MNICKSTWSRRVDELSFRAHTVGKRALNKISPPSPPATSKRAVASKDLLARGELVGGAVAVNNLSHFC